MSFRILVSHTPPENSWAQGVVYEWSARCIDPLPEVRAFRPAFMSHPAEAVSLEGVGSTFHGRTKEEAVEAVRADIQRRFQRARDRGVTVICEEIDVNPAV